MIKRESLKSTSIMEQPHQLLLTHHKLLTLLNPTQLVQAPPILIKFKSEEPVLPQLLLHSFKELHLLAAETHLQPGLEENEKIIHNPTNYYLSI